MSPPALTHCVFRTMSATDSGQSRPPIPIDVGYRLGGIPNTREGVDAGREDLYWNREPC